RRQPAAPGYGPSRGLDRGGARHRPAGGEGRPHQPRRGRDRSGDQSEDVVAEISAIPPDRQWSETMTDRSQHPIVHFVGSIPLPDSETVFRTLSKATGPHLTRLPDGETGIRKTWIKFLQDVLSGNSAIEFAKDVPPFKFTQWDGKVVREIPRLRVKPGATIDPSTFKTGYADMAIESWAVFERLQKAGDIPAGVKFQICIPTPIAPTYNNMVPGDRPKLLPPLTQHFLGEVAKIAKTLPNDRIAIQWDVCQEVLAWEGYYDKGPVDFRTECIDVLT